MDAITVKAAQAVCKLWKRYITREKGDPPWAIKRYIMSKTNGWRPRFEFRMLVLNDSARTHLLCATCQVRHPRDFFPRDLGPQRALELCCKEGLKQIWLLGFLRVELRDAMETYSKMSTRAGFEERLDKFHWVCHLDFIPRHQPSRLDWALYGSRDFAKETRVMARNRKELHDLPPDPCHFISRERFWKDSPRTIVKMATIQSHSTDKFKGVLHQFVSLVPVNVTADDEDETDCPYKIVLRTRAYITVERCQANEGPDLDDGSKHRLQNAINSLGFPLCPHRYFGTPAPTRSQASATGSQASKSTTQVPLCWSESFYHWCDGTTVCEPCQARLCVELWKCGKDEVVLRVSALSDLALFGGHSGAYCDEQLNMWEAPRFGPGWAMDTRAGRWYQARFGCNYHFPQSYEKAAKEIPRLTGLVEQTEITMPSDAELE